MPNYYYNGVELPALPEWDKEKYPYAVMFQASTFDYTVLIVSKDCPYIYHSCASTDIHWLYWDYLTWGKDHAGEGEDTALLEYRDFVQREDVGEMANYYQDITDITFIWSNCDIYWEDEITHQSSFPNLPDLSGTLWLAASVPIPVDGWKKHDAYKPNAKWDGRTFYKVIGNKWVRLEAVVPTAEVLPYYNNYLTFSSDEPFTIGIYNSTKNWDGMLYYSTDRKTWNKWDGTTVIASTEHEAEQRIYMRGIGNSVITGTVEAKHRFVLDGNEIRCTGNIENLLDYRSVAVGIQPEMKAYCYSHLFGYCYNLIQAPELPSTLLAHSCYNGMFFNCTHLTTAPELPGTSLTGYCYSGMFRGCTSLLAAPKLQANILNEYCYRNMFYDCTSLTTIPELSATNLKKGCYENMFNGCTNIKLSSIQTGEYQTKYQIPMGGGGIIAEGALNGMFENTGGTFTGTPEINAIYYTANEVAKNS